jgi:hypothetical protein
MDTDSHRTVREIQSKKTYFAGAFFCTINSFNSPLIELMTMIELIMTSYNTGHCHGQYFSK